MDSLEHDVGQLGLIEKKSVGRKKNEELTVQKIRALSLYSPKSMWWKNVPFIWEPTSHRKFLKTCFH
jgi:hypothetical protein